MKITLKKSLSLIISTLMLVSATSFSVSANSGKKELVDIRNAIETLEQESGTNIETNTYYFYMPDEWLNEYNDYYDGSDPSTYSAGIYWWEGTAYSETWPGYAITKKDIGCTNVYIAEVPKDVSYVVWNNSVDGGNDSVQPVYTKAFKSANACVCGYQSGEDMYGFYPNGLKSMENMIFVCNPFDAEMNYVSGKLNLRGEWFYYYGNGEYGFAPTREEAGDWVYSEGEFPSLETSVKCINIGIGETASFTTNKGRTYATSIDDKIASVTLDSTTSEFTVLGVSEGETTIEVSYFNENNGRVETAVIEVSVSKTFSTSESTIPSVPSTPQETTIPSESSPSDEVGEPIESGDYQYVILNDGTIRITAYFGEEAHVNIPPTIDGYIVTELERTFCYDQNVTLVEIPESVVSIGESTFQECTNLTNVIIGTNVRYIGNYAFMSCENLSGITIPGSVTYIGEEAFLGCYNLSTLYIDSIQSWFNINFGSNSNPLQYVKHLFVNEQQVNDIVIPEGVTEIDDRFSYCSLIESITISDSVVNISESAFGYCENLKQISFGHNVQSIGKRAFVGCCDLTEIEIPSSVTNIGEMAFYDCINLKKVVFDNDTVNIGTNAFGYYFAYTIDGMGPCPLIDFVIYGYKDASSQIYANKNGFKFIELVQRPTTEPNESTEPTQDNSTGTTETSETKSTDPIESTFPTETEPTAVTEPSESINTDPTESATSTKPTINTKPTESTTKPSKTIIKLTKNKATLYVTGKTKINGKIENGIGMTTYKSSNSKVATVNAKGKVTAKKAGKAVITVKNNSVSKKFTVTVKKPTLNKKTVTLKKNKSFTLKIKGKVGKAKFTTNNKKIATVNNKGKIVAKKKGTVTIKVKTNGITLKCKVKVK